MFDRLKEPSSAAGATLVLNGVLGVLTNWRDGQAWGSVIGGLFAIFLREKAAS